MKFLVLALLVAQAVIQITTAQCIRTVSGPLISSANPIISSYGGAAIGPCGNPVINPCGCGGSVINPCGCGGPIINPSYAVPAIAAPTIIQTNSVAASLADTLSLLTVSSLLADTLPLGSNVYGVPVGGCGCGGGYGGYYY